MADFPDARAHSGILPLPSPQMAASDSPATLSGYVSHGTAVMLLRLALVTVACLLVLLAVIETSVRLAWPGWAFWLATVPVLLGMAVAIFAAMWQSGTITADASGVRVAYHRLGAGERRLAWAWRDVKGYRFDTDAQGRPYVHVTPATGVGVSVYGRSGADLSRFEAAFRAAAAVPHDGALSAVAEEASFYSRPLVRWGSLVLFGAAVAVSVALTHSDHPDAWRSLWLLAVTGGFAARAWF